MAVKTTKETKKAAETKTAKAPKAATKPESVFISKDDEYLFAQGTHYDIYKKLGAHVSEENGKKGIYFAVWAPNAQRVHVVGDFNGWNEWSHELRRLGPGGIHALFVPDLGVGELYKYVITTADGKKLYRVLENLLSNISKYSLENTRVYIDIIEEDDKVRLTMKNISSYELNFDPEEIMERFKRADESRNTEGSGLGLAIARDLVNAQGGRFEIDIDGDLFKSVVEFNLID